MTVATIVVSVLLAVLLALSAAMKLSHREGVVAMYAGVGVPEDKLNYLAIILLAGAAGLLLGLWWAPIGIAAAIGLICYFVGAVVFHVRANDTKNIATPTALGLAAAVVLALQLASL
jgi:hypothetical protein